jgi:hypothetical protein
MRSWLTRILVGTVAAASVAIAPATMAVAKPHHHAKRHPALRADKADAPENSSEAAENTGSDNDAAQQAAACQKAGVDPNGSNVQYDDQSGTCTANGGADNQQQQ